ERLKEMRGDGHRDNEVIQSIRAMFAKGYHGGVPLDANELIRETIAMARGELQAGRIVVDLELAEQLPLIPAHKGQLQQVVLNIVTNAADSMRSIKDRVRLLRVRSRPFDSNGVAVSVQQSAAGRDTRNGDLVFDTSLTIS